MKNLNPTKLTSKPTLPFFALELINNPKVDPDCYWLVSLLLADFDHAPRIPDLYEYVNRERHGRDRISLARIKKIIMQLEATGHLEIRRVMLRPHRPAMEWTFRFQNGPSVVLEATDLVHIMV